MQKSWLALVILIGCSLIIHACLFVPGCIRYIKERRTQKRTPETVFNTKKTTSSNKRTRLLPFYRIDTPIANTTSAIHGQFEDGGKIMVQYWDIWDSISWVNLPEWLFLVVILGISLSILVLLMIVVLLSGPTPISRFFCPRSALFICARIVLILCTLLDVLALIALLSLAAFVIGNIGDYASREKLVGVNSWLAASKISLRYTFGFYLYLIDALLIHGLLAFSALRYYNFRQAEKLMYA